MDEKQKRVTPQEMERQMRFIRLVKDSHPAKRPLACVLTYGCQQNENDSERLRGMLREMGYAFTQDKQSADLIVFNTCAVRENAELKVYGQVGALKHLKRQKPGLKIALCGCMMQQEYAAGYIKRKYPHVDMVFGTHAIYRFPEILYQAMQEERVFDTADDPGRIAEGVPMEREGTVKSGVSVMYGCNNFCSYCIVPYVRGRERSRSREEILKEIQGLADTGYREIMLLGQNVNSYGKDLGGGFDFADLLGAAAGVPGIDRIRFMTSHPKDISEKLIRMMAENKTVCNQLHLPFQSGSNRILAAMNRRYTREHYLDLIRLARSYMPDVALSSDVIVGFPGETEEDFCQTLDLVEQVRFDGLFTFLYSKRRGTPAEKLPDDTPHAVKQERFDRLLELQNRISKEINDSFVGRTVEVLAEGPSKTDPSVMTGRTEGNKVVNFPGTKDCIGKLVPVKIHDAHTWSLTGEMARNDTKTDNK